MSGGDQQEEARPLDDAPALRERVEELERVVAELRSAEETLRIKEKWLGEIEDHLPDGTVYRLIHTPDGRMYFEHVSAGFERIFGLTASAMSRDAEALYAMLHPDDRDEALRVQQQAADNLAAFRYECRFVLSSGDTRWVRWHSMPERLADGGLAWSGVAIDVTERRQAEIALRISEAKFRALAEQSIAGTCLIQNGKFVYVNPRLAEILDFRQEEMVGLPVLDLVAEPDRDLVTENMRKRISGEVPYIHYTFHALKKGGTQVLFEVHGGVLEYLGHPAIMATVLDITERKRADDELRKFKFISDNSADAHFLVDRDAKFQYVNETACRLMRYSKEELLELGVPDVDLVYDMKEYRDLFDLIQHKTIPPIETTNKRKDGSFFPAEITVTGHIIGEKPYMFAALRDATERKRAEERIRFLSLITEQMSDSVLATGPDFKIIYANATFRKLYGYSEEEVLGLSPGMLNAEPAAEDIQYEIHETVSSGETWRGELLNRRKDGTTFPCELTVVPLLDETGKAFAYAGFQRDITERKRVEEALRFVPVSRDRNIRGDS